ncbi:hypothetical protein KY284_020736 [Solanum tuberosum]|nr:hypothetical protein KY284_020736 [Solanum tuberosum]
MANTKKFPPSLFSSVTASSPHQVQILYQLRPKSSSGGGGGGGGGGQGRGRNTNDENGGGSGYGEGEGRTGRVSENSSPVDEASKNGEKQP